MSLSTVSADNKEDLVCGEIAIEQDLPYENTVSIYRGNLDIRQLSSGNYRLLIIDGERVHTIKSFLMRVRQ